VPRFGVLWSESAGDELEEQSLVSSSFRTLRTHSPQTLMPQPPKQDSTPVTRIHDSPQGVISYVAVFLITYLAFAMLRFANIEEKYSKKLQVAAKNVSLSISVGLVWSSDQALLSVAAAPSLERLAERCRGGGGQRVVTVHTQCTRNAHAMHTQCTRNAHAMHTQCTRNATQTNSTSPNPDPPPTPSQPIQTQTAQAAANATNPLGHRGHGYSVFLLAFTAVLREGIESVIFLAGGFFLGGGFASS